jgi:hypothetical protein
MQIALRRMAVNHEADDFHRTGCLLTGQFTRQDLRVNGAAEIPMDTIRRAKYPAQQRPAPVPSYFIVGSQSRKVRRVSR